MFIAFDGIDGAGKTTIYQKIADELSEDYEVQLFDMGKLGFLDDVIKNIKTGKNRCDANIREYLYYFEGNLFSDQIARRYVKDKKRHILIDRYILSYMSYGPLNGVPIEKIRLVTKQMIWPDLYFYIDTKPEIALERILKYRDIDKPEIGFGNSLSDNQNSNKDSFIKFQTQVRRNFQSAINMIKGDVHIIDNDISTSHAIENIKTILNQQIL